MAKSEIRSAVLQEGVDGPSTVTICVEEEAPQQQHDELSYSSASSQREKAVVCESHEHHSHASASLSESAEQKEPAAKSKDETSCASSIEPADPADKVDPAAPNPQNQTEQVLQLLLQRVQQQETSIQKLETTVQSQNDALQDIMITMTSGFAALLESKNNPKKDTTVHDSQLPLPRYTDVKQPTTVPPKMPPRNPTHPRQSAEFINDTMSTLGMPMAVDNMVAPTASFSHSYGTPSNDIHKPHPKQQRASLPPAFFGRKSMSLLLDDDSTIATDDLVDHDEHHGHHCFHLHHHDEGDDRDHSHHHKHAGLEPSLGSGNTPDANPKSSSCCTISSCRKRIAQANGSRSRTTQCCVKEVKDKMPSHPTYVPSPSTKRLARAISAPLTNFAGRRKGMPRLPAREDSISEASLSFQETNHIGRSDSMKMPKMPTRDASFSEGLDIGTFSSAVEEQVVAAMESLKETMAVDESSERPSSPVPTPADLAEPSTPAVEAATEMPGSSSPRPCLQGSQSWRLPSRSTATSIAGVSQAPSNPSKHSVPRSFRGSRRDLFTRGTAHLNVSCVTLDSAFADESHAWMGGTNSDMDNTIDNVHKKGGQAVPTILESGESSCTQIEKQMTDATGETGVYSGGISPKKNQPHGHGIMQYSNGKHYMGGWKEGSWHGSGILTSASGERYEGEFVFATRHGHGFYEYDNGDSYEGDFSADKPHGKGTFRFADGGVYCGGFVFGSFDGQGWYEFDGGRYEGMWEAGCYHGFGKLQYIDGGWYTGEFEGGKPHGSGEVHLADGNQRKGLWKQGELIDEEEPETSFKLYA